MQPNDGENCRNVDDIIIIITIIIIIKETTIQYNRVLNKDR